MTETLPIDNERAIAVTQFYLPIDEESEFSDKEGWFKMMIISVYPIEAWEEERAECEELDLCWDEEIGRDANYVYAWSFFNGIQPSDIPEQAIWDMEKIVETFKGSSKPKHISWDGDTEMVIYRNCEYGYQLPYPERWNRVTKGSDSSKANFKGDGITIGVNAFDNALTLESFAAKRTQAWQTEPVSSRDQERDGKRLIAYEYDDPEAVYVFWQEGDYNLELAVTGDNAENFIVETGFFTVFNNNISESELCK